MSDERADDEKKLSGAASVWARGGEGPHALSLPIPAEPSADEPAPTIDNIAALDPTKKVNTAVNDLHDLVVMAGEAQSSVLANEQKASAGAELAKEKIGAAAFIQKDQIEPADPSDSAGQPDQAVQEVEADQEHQEHQEHQEDQEDQEGRDEEADDQSASDGSPGKNDIAFGYLIPLAIFFVAYAGNYLAGGYCLSSEKVNALAEMAFFWTPAVGALCLLMGTRALQISGAILFVPLAAVAVFAIQYFHSYERFQTEIGAYGPLVKAYDANNWRICRYESNWTSGSMPGITYTREKDVAPYVVYVKKMRMGEPP